jgi:RHS repeat-associated protein
MNTNTIDRLVIDAHLAQGIPTLTPPAGATGFGGSIMSDSMIDVNDGTNNGIEQPNLLSDETYSYTYDVANQLKTVSANGVMLLTNDYDSKSRRVRKVTPAATTTYFYDDWNLIEEYIAYTNDNTSITHYYWGKDLSGTLQGAGGIGGLLFLTIDDELYIPTYDNNGNITHYLDSNGNVVAQYTYDAFGKAIEQSGLLVNTFRHRYSTKYFDNETSLYYYGYRFYHPTLMRWLNRDPIEEDGGINLYAFSYNAPVYLTDALGQKPQKQCKKMVFS